MADFGILNNLIGQRTDIPHLKLPAGIVSEESQWCHYWRDAVRRMKGRELTLGGIQTPDTNPILHYHYHVSVAGLGYLFAFTATHAYVWDNNNTEWDLMFTSGGTCTRWSVEDFDNYVVATNNIDKVQYWDDASPATQFANLGGANGIEYATGVYLTKAEYVKRHWNYLHLFSTTENSVAYPEYDRWCSAGDITDWDTDGAGDTNFRKLAAGDLIQGVAIFNVGGVNQLMVFTQRSVNMAWLVTADIVYESEDILGIGCVAANSIIETPDGQVYYLAINPDGVREVRRIGDPNPMSYDIQSALDLIHPTLDAYVCGIYVGKLRQLWWSVPSGGASTENDRVLVLDLRTGFWQPDIPIGVSAFGHYVRQTTEYIDDVSDIIDTVSGTIDSYAPVTGDAVFLVGDASGYTYVGASSEQDAGADYDGTLVIGTDFTAGGGWNWFKRLHGLWLFLKSHPGATNDTVTVSMRKGDEAEWVNLGTISLDGDGQTVRKFLRYDRRLRDGHVKLTATNGFEFLGVIFELDYTGPRL